ncbi:tetratricopeptide repeat protein [Candidatus Pacearchaeota archaeon]|nr:tetratricopeptide repeat protein [Candidatus Pacearchaeota archaeon]
MNLRNLKRFKKKRSQKESSKSSKIDSGQLLRRARKLHQVGDFIQAERHYKQALEISPNDIATLNDLGALYHSMGRFKEATVSYKNALSFNPDYSPALINYGLLLYDRNLLDEAIKMFNRVLAANPQQCEALLNMGLAFHKKGLLDKAVDSFQRILNKNPDDIHALNNLALVLREQDKPDEAKDFYSRIVALDHHFFEAYYGIGLINREQGKIDEAIVSFRKVLEINPHHGPGWKNLGDIYASRNEFNDAISAYEKVLEIHPTDFLTMNKIGGLMQEQGNLHQAISYFNKAISINHEFTGTRYALAETLEKYNKVDDALIVALKGLDIAPDNIPLQVITAICERRLGNYPQSLARLSAIDLANADLSLEQQIHFELGFLYDKEEKSDKAYAHFQEGNNASEKYYRTANPKVQLDLVDSLQEQCHGHGPIFSSHSSQETDSPIFVVGFPRSGTTLLDQILDSHPMMQTMEEKPIISSLHKKIVPSIEQYWECVQNVTKDQIEEIQNHYYQQVDSFIDRQPACLLVDRNPLNIIHLPLIWRIFPNARIILMIRHPYDVCLSCFMQDFKMNTTNANFFSLEGSASFYTKVMQLWKCYTDILPLNYRIIHYENLIADLEGETRKLLNFLNVGWSENVLTYYEHARSREEKIKTASYHQVIQPLYSSATFRWKRYERHFESIKEKLAPFVDFFGYGE